MGRGNAATGSIDVTLRSFLVEFGDSPRLPRVCAVTAYDERDALALIRNVYSPDAELPEPVILLALAPAEILARIGTFDFGVPVLRGIWYPHLDNP